MTSKTVVLLNPYGTDVTPFVNHTSGYAQLMSGSVGAVGDTVYTLPYNNNVSTSANITTGAGLLDTKLNATSGEVLVFGYSEGCQIADYWLTNYGPTTSVSTADVSFLLIGNANRKYGGFAYDRSVFNSVGYTGGKPDDTPFRVIDFVRQYDPVGDFPTATAIVNALVDLSYVGSDANYTVGAFQSVWNVLASTPYSNTMNNVLDGLVLIHTGLGVAGTGYMSVTVSDPVNVEYVESGSNITWLYSPTYPVPMLGVGGTFPQTDQQLRLQIEQSYTRPVTIPMPDYGANTGWGVEPFPLPVSPPPVTGWWAELHVAVAITVTPAISVSHGFIGGAVAIVVTPAVSGSSKTLVLASVIQMVTVTASASVILSRGATVTATPSVTPVAGLLSSVASSVTVTPSVSVAAEITTTASVSVAVSVTPSVSVAAVVTESAAVATTVTPSVTVAAAVIKPASVAVSVTPSVSVAATINEPATASITVTPTVTVAAAVGETAAVSVSVTPSVSVSAAVTLSDVAYDATGSGDAPSSAASSLSWSHDAAAGAYVLAFIIISGGTVSSCNYGSTPMTLLASQYPHNSPADGYLYVYELSSAPSGSETITVGLTTNVNAVANSVSYTNAATPAVATTYGESTTPSQGLTCASGQMLVGAFGWTGSTFTSSSGGTQRYEAVNTTGSNAGLVIQDSTSSTTFGAVLPGGPPWAGLGVTLSVPNPVAITVTPTVSVSMSAPTVVGAVAATVTPTVTASAVVTRFATVTSTVTPAITAAAGVTRFATVTETVTPTVTTVGLVILPVSVAITATPSIATATADDTSITVTVTPSVTAAAVVTRIATVTETVTPTVTAAAVVTEFANVAVTVTPAVTVAGASIANIASAVTVTPSVAAASSTAVAAAITVTPSVSTVSADDSSISVTVTPSVTVAATVIKVGAVAVSVTPSVAAVGGTLYTNSVAVTATPSVSVAGVSGVVGAVAVTATPSVTVAMTSGSPPAFDATAVSAYKSAISGTTFTLSITAAAGADVIVGVYGTTVSRTPTSVTVPGATFTSLGNTGTGAGIAVFRGAGVGTGSALTITVTISTTGFTGWADANSYTNVTGVGTLQTATGGSGNPSLSVPCSVNDIVWGAIWNSAPATYSAFSLTQREYKHTGSDSPYFISGDTVAAASSVTVGATQSAGAWAVAGLDIQ